MYEYGRLIPDKRYGLESRRITARKFPTQEASKSQLFSFSRSPWVISPGRSASFEFDW